MNTYYAFYKGKKIELEAETSYQAQEKAAITFKARKSYEVSVILVALSDKKEIVHVAVD
jgi:hypothetical protein